MEPVTYSDLSNGNVLWGVDVAVHRLSRGKDTFWCTSVWIGQKVEVNFFLPQKKIKKSILVSSYANHFTVFYRAFVMENFGFHTSNIDFDEELVVTTLKKA